MIRNILRLPKPSLHPRTCHRPVSTASPRFEHITPTKGKQTPNGKRLFQIRRQFSQNVDSHLPILELPLRYLRSMDQSHFDATTHQRLGVRYNPDNGKPIPIPIPIIEQEKTSKDLLAISECFLDPDTDSYRILWQDGLSSEYSKKWVMFDYRVQVGSTG